MNTKNNQRFRDTEIKMEASMLRLMKKYDFDKITVKKICEESKVNRSTFYAHFTDIYDMLNKMETELRRELIESFKQDKKDEKNTMFSEESFIKFLEHIEKHKYFYKINLNTRKSFPIEDGFEQLYPIIEKRSQKAGIYSRDEIMYYYVSFQAGFTMILKRWVDNDCKERKDQIAKIIKNCIPSILYK